MKIQLRNARLSFDANDKRVLSEDELAFITGESAILSGTGTSSTSGATCCDNACFCKRYEPIDWGSGSGSGSGSRPRPRPRKGSK